MLKKLALASALLCALTITAEARQRHKVIVADPGCNVIFPCEGVAPSPRGEKIAKAVGFGVAQKVYTPRVSRVEARPRARVLRFAASNEVAKINTAIVAHPAGCPSRAFCGCGAVERLKTAWGVVLGQPRSLWLAANWFKFPRAAPAPGMVAVRQHHVFVLEASLGGGDRWQVYDANSGGGKTRIHARSIAGYTIVNPRGGSA